MLLEHEEKKALAKALTFMSSLSLSEYNLLERSLVLLNYEKGQALHHGGVDCSGLLIVREGQLRTFIISDSGKEITLFRLLKGDNCILTASCAFRNITFDVHVEAQTDSLVYLLPTAIYQQLERSNPTVHKFGNDIIAARFSEVMWLMEQVVFMRLDKRLAHFILDQAALSNKHKLNLTHEAIAHDIGTAREVITRLLKYFASEGLVGLARGEITLKDINRLKAMAEL